MTSTIPILGYMLSLFSGPDTPPAKSIKQDRLNVESMPAHLRRDLGLDGRIDIPAERIVPLERMFFR